MKDDNKYYFLVTIYGNNFSPKILKEKSDLIINEIVAKGDKIFRNGNFIKYADYSYASYNKTVEQNENWNVVFNFILDTLVENYESIKVAQGTTINVYIGIEYKNQCNFELRVDEIEKLNKIKATIAISTGKEGNII